MAACRAGALRSLCRALAVLGEQTGVSFVNACSRPESALLLPLLLLPRARHACSRGAHLCHPVANPAAPIGGLTVGEGGPAAAALHPPAAPGTAASAALHYFLLVFSNVDTATSTCIIVSCIYPLHTFSAWQRAQQPPLLPPPSPWRGAAAHIWGLPGSCKSKFDPVCRTAKVSPCKVISCSGLFGLAASGHAKSTAARRRCNGGTTSVPRMDPSRHVTPHFRLAASLRGSTHLLQPSKGRPGNLALPPCWHGTAQSTTYPAGTNLSSLLVRPLPRLSTPWPTPRHAAPATL